jgi:DNA-binding IclR family transcriptional regulator
MVRQRGHAIDNEENEPGVACIGASILDGDGQPTAAVSMSGPVHRILIREMEIARALQAVCQRVSQQMGFAIPRASQRVEFDKKFSMNSPQIFRNRRTK